MARRRLKGERLCDTEYVMVARPPAVLERCSPCEARFFFPPGRAVDVAVVGGGPPTDDRRRAGADWSVAEVWRRRS